MSRDEDEAGMRHGVSPTKGRRRACIGREDNGVPEWGIFNAVETITVLSGIANRAPVFPEVEFRAGSQETETQERPCGAYLTESLGACDGWPLQGANWLHCGTPLSSRPTPYTSRVETGRPRGTRSAITSLEKKSRESQAESFNFQLT